MNSVSDKVLKKIHKEQIKPKPRWYFVLMHSILWLSLVATIILGSLSVAIILRHLFETDWELVRRIKPGRIGGFIVMLPYLWFAFMGAAFYGANKLFIHTKKGYRIKPRIVIIGSILASLLIGSLFFYSRTGERFEQGLSRHVPPYKQWQQIRERVFVAPSEGVLVGTVAEVNSEEMIIIIDFKNSSWTVDISSAKISPEANIKTGERLGFTGEQTDVFSFKAEQVRKFFKKSERTKLPPRSNK